MSNHSCKDTCEYLWEVKAPRFLIVRFSSIGDIILSAPVIHAIRKHFGKEARIDFVTLKPFKGAAELLPDLNEIHLVEKVTIEIVPTLKKLNFDYIIDLHGSVRSRSLSNSLNVLTFSVDKQTFPRFALILGLRKAPIPHFIDRSFALVKAFGIPLPTSSPWGSLNTKPPATHINLPSSYITVAPGAAHLGKAIPYSTLKAICIYFSSQNIHIALVGGPDSKTIASSLISENSENSITSFCGYASLSETAYVLKNSMLAIGGDTGAMHIASALGTPLISVWGCTRPSLGLSPWRPHPASTILLPINRDTRPCSRHGAKCRFTRKGQDLCINHVSPARIIEAATRIIN
ncbi:MAG: hypothetical protein COA49_06380 [Bacteroidetes bacterium]|nr:MAG: hypothetical protein COA49_06380 [Bacteroidota bacterium]